MRRRLLQCAIYLSVFPFALTSPAPAADRADNWPQWRGPDATGASTTANPPIKWDAKTNIKWNVALPGRGSATPIVWDDQVFILTAIKTDRIATGDELPKINPKLPVKTDRPKNFFQFVVISYDRATGKERWRKIAAEKVPHEGHHASHSYAAASPTTDGRFLYVSFGSRGIYCYDLKGNLIWQRDLGRLETRFAFGESVTPVVHGDSLLLNWDQEEDSALICLDARTGQTKWKVPRDEKTSWNTPLVVEHQGKTQVIVNGTKRVRSHDLETGTVLWEHGGMTVNAIPSAVTAGGVAYILSGYSGSLGIAVPLGLRGDLSSDSKVLWRVKQGTPYVPSPLLMGDRLYYTQSNNAQLTVLDIKTGKALIDRERLPGLATFYSSPVGAAGRVYLADQKGTTLVIRASDRLEVLATNPLDDPIDASPAVAGRQLFLRGEKNLYCIEEK